MLPKLSPSDGGQLLDVLIGQLADRVAEAVAERLGTSRVKPAPEWLGSREAAAYLGLHRDTLRKLAAERAIPAEQDGPGCKLFFRRSALDDWRLAGGRAVHIAATLAA
jgi:excisionase family DNA binding protein